MFIFLDFNFSGILNHEELSLLNKGPKKSEIDMFPRIEELWISSDSNCTIDSDGSSLASLEVSMHQSRVAPSTVALSSRNIQKVYCKYDFHLSLHLPVDITF